MPGYDRLGLNHGERRAPVTPNAGEKDPQHAVPSGQFRAFCRRPLKHADLMAQSQILEFEGSALAEDRTQSSKECREKNEHRRRVYESSINGSRSDISRFSRATIKRPQADLPVSITWRPFQGRAFSVLANHTTQNPRNRSVRSYCSSVVGVDGIFAGSTCTSLWSPVNRSSGTGNMIVVFFSTPISVRVCK